MRHPSWLSYTSCTKRCARSHLNCASSLQDRDSLVFQRVSGRRQDYETLRDPVFVCCPASSTRGVRTVKPDSAFVVRMRKYRKSRAKTASKFESSIQLLTAASWAVAAEVKLGGKRAMPIVRKRALSEEDNRLNAVRESVIQVANFALKDARDHVRSKRLRTELDCFLFLLQPTNKRFKSGRK